MEWIDTHCHLYSSKFEGDRDEVYARALEADVVRTVLPNVNLATLPMMEDCLQRYEGTLAGIGLHPCEVKGGWRAELRALEHAYGNGQTDRYVAVGEIGLDLYWDKTTFADQRAAFIHQLEWARELRFPMLVHARDAVREVLDIVSQARYDDVPLVLHAFSAPLDQLQAALSLPQVFIGVGGVATFKNGLGEAVIRALDLDRTLLETDAPYLAPVPHRGKRNESAYVPIIGEHVARVRGGDVEEVAGRTTGAARRFLGL
ncbi:MAG: hydrolase TatD [Bacteroidia bacterium]|nr:MAG: hydrolase TatD [Bacteroidia bacterium]